MLGVLQAFVGPPAICPCQAARTQLDTAVPADDEDYDLIEILCLDGRQNGAPGVGASP